MQFFNIAVVAALASTVAGLPYGQDVTAVRAAEPMLAERSWGKWGSDSGSTTNTGSAGNWDGSANKAGNGDGDGNGDGNEAGTGNKAGTDDGCVL